jgi:EmrB/QacA subfamily drug resistance transporter
MVLSLAQFLVILDTSIIGVALPTIQQHFGFSQAELQWIFSAYVIVFGALLLLGGRLSDILGQRKIFVIGFAVLTSASILAGLAPTGDILIAARALQGVGAAFIAPAAMSMVLKLFTVPNERSKAMGIWGAAAPAGGTAGVFLGGMITAYFDWSWVFLINVPIGIAVLALTRPLLPQGLRQKGKVDFAGAIAITAALIMLVYAIVTANENGWTSVSTIGLLLGSVGLLAAFVAIQKRSKSPLIPLGIFKVRNLKSSNIVMALLGAAWIPMWFFLNLYLQQVHGYGPFESGLALLPMTAAIMILMVGASSRIISRLGVRTSMVAGLSLLAVAMVLFSAMPSSGGSFVVHVLPASLVAAVGMSLAYIPVLMSAVSHAKQEESGLASGIVNTSYQIGSALGLAVIVALASSQIQAVSSGVSSTDGLNAFQLAFIGAGIIAGLASIIALLAIRKSNGSSEKEVPMAAG